MVLQDFFREMTDQDVRKRIYEENKNLMEQDMAPFGFIVSSDEEETIVDKDGNVWNVDEYGTKQYEVDYMMPYI
tara:strand:- start:416 stop:637 length:222 start_codon:yes stop_codon:yes gene_type:complete